MFFMIHALDKAHGGDIRADHREAHRARLRNPEPPIRVHVAGPLLSQSDEMIGSLILVEADSHSAVEHFLAGDPYVINGLFETVEVRPFKWTIGVPPAAS